MSLLLTVNLFHTLASVSIVDFDQVTGSREYISTIICTYKIWFFCKVGNYIVISNSNISALTVKVILLFNFFLNKIKQTKPQTRLNFFNPSFLQFTLFKRKVLTPPTQIYLGKLISPFYEGFRLCDETKK